MNISTTYVAAFIAAVAGIAPMFGWEVNAEIFSANVQELIAGLAILYTFYGRFKAGGVTAFGLRKA